MTVKIYSLSPAATPAPSVSNASLGFGANTVIVDNPTAQWWSVGTPGQTVAPWTLGQVIALASPTQVASISMATPEGKTSSPAAGQTATFQYTDQVLPAAAGNVIALDATIENATFEITGTANVDVQNAVETNAGMLGGNDAISGSPFTVAGGSTGGTGALAMANWGGLTAVLVSPSNSLASGTLVDVDISADGTTWFTVQQVAISGQDAVALSVPRLSAYCRLNIPTAGTSDVTMFVRYSRSEIASLTAKFYAPFLVASNFGVAISAGFWAIQSVNPQPGSELLYVHVTSPAAANTLAVGIGSGGTGIPALELDYQTSSSNDFDIKLGPYPPGSGIPIIINGTVQSDFLIYAEQNDLNVAWEVWYR